MAKQKLSQTMRIDLIPDTPAETDPGKRQRLVITTPSRQRRLVERVRSADESADDSAYHELLQSIYDAALICDLTGRIVNVNARAVEFLLYRREALIGMSVFDMISGADESLIDTLCENLEEQRYTLIQAYCMRKNETLFPAEIAVNRLRIGSDFLCFFVRDITWRRQAEEMLRTEHNAIQNAGNGIAVADIEARLEYVNPAVARLWGYDRPEDLVGSDVRDLVCDVDRASDMIGTVMGDGETWTGELNAVRRDGSRFDVDISAVCNRNSDGEIAGIVFSLVDVSDRKKAAEIERENERHRVMLESLGAACHHLGQPATVLLANLGMMQNQLDKDLPISRELIEGSIDAMKSLGGILHKLHAVNEYKTTRYLGDSEDAETSRILDI